MAISRTQRMTNAKASCVLSRSTSARGGTKEESWTQKVIQASGPFPKDRALAKIRDEARAELASPTPPDAATRESYRFTDLRGLQDISICRSDEEEVQAHATALPEGAYLGPLSDAPPGAVEAFDAQARSRGTFFTTLNAACVTEVTVLYLPKGVHVSEPVQLLRTSPSHGLDPTMDLSVQAPRTLVVVEEGASVEVWEMFEGELPCYTNVVTEVVVAPKGKVVHRIVQLEGEGAFHTQQTLVTQGESSTYDLIDVCIGGKLARHDVCVEQEGPHTETRMKHLVICGEDQVHDVHTSVRLDHPHGVCQQLHKCIVTHGSGRGVFDGNVQVERGAQQTDAGQLTRNLLLEKNATVNVRPNLQIVADDVTCTHGATVSDLEEEELFYFQSRGIDPVVARDMLVHSFGAEVVQELGNRDLIAKVEGAVRRALSQRR